MWARTQRKQTGFTIVEVMIVLAVTGILFISVAIAISGKQQTAEFESSIHDVQSQIQQTINDVASGFYPSSADFTCSAPTGAPSLHFDTGTTAQGENNGCVFLGKMLHFYDASTVGTNSTQFTLYTVAGSQAGTDTLAKALPKLIPGITIEGNPINNTTSDNLQYGLTAKSMTYRKAAGDSFVPIGAIAFLQSIGTVDSGDVLGGLQSGAQKVNVVVPTTGSENLSFLRGAELGAINTDFQNGSYDVNPDEVQICFASGSTDQSGLITIGGGGSNLTVGLQIENGQNCGASS